MATTLTKSQVKDWLKKNNYSRDWLAEQCGVSKQSVDTWLSKSRDIPRHAELKIRQLMAGEKAPEMAVRIAPVEVAVELPPDVYDAFAWYAKEQKITVKEAVYVAMKHAADHVDDFFDDLYKQHGNNNNGSGGALIS